MWICVDSIPSHSMSMIQKSRNQKLRGSKGKSEELDVEESNVLSFRPAISRNIHGKET